MAVVGVVASGCYVVAAGFTALGGCLAFLEVHLADDEDDVRTRLGRIYHALDDSSLGRLPSALMETLAAFHTLDPRGRWAELLRRWWIGAGLAMLLVADAILTAWYPHDSAAFYHDIRGEVLDEVPFTVYDENLTFVLAALVIVVILWAFVKGMGATAKLEASSPYESSRPSPFVDPSLILREKPTLDWRQIAFELLAVLVSAILCLLFAFGFVVVVRRFTELPITLGVAVSLLSFPFLAVTLIYSVLSALILLEQVLKLVIALVHLVRRDWRRIDLDRSQAVLDWVFDHFEYCVLFVLGLSLSLAMTFLAFALGHWLHPEVVAPRSLQLFAANALGDGLTLSLTFLLVRWAVASEGAHWRIPVVILLDLLLAAALASLALHVGLWGTPQALSPGEVIDVLLGRAPDGVALQLGPYFWVMHTTFLPLTLYLVVLLLLWLIKIALDPAVWIIRQASSRQTPLKYLAAASGMYAALFAAAGVVFDQLG